MFAPIFLFLLLCAGGLNADFIGSRILGGEAAASGIAPYLVSIQDLEWNHICAGTIIDTRWILTSASCVMDNKIKSIVPGLTTYIPKKIPEFAYHISKMVPHPEFFAGETINDIGLLKTLQTIVYSNTIKALPWATTLLGPNQVLTLVGWDFTATGTSYRLKSLNLTSMSNSQCESDVDDTVIVDATHLCGMRSAGKGACGGDNGLAIVNGGRVQGIVGLLPADKTKCALGYPEVYTRVSSFNAWITAERVKN